MSSISTCTRHFQRRMAEVDQVAALVAVPKSSIVSGAMLIEPTESVGHQELDQFIEAMRSIAREALENPELVLNAPHSTRIGRLDEAGAARKPVLRWKPKETVTESRALASG